jgi:hypothetical protein
MTTKAFVSLSYCGINKINPNITRSCNKPCTRHIEYVYEWRHGSWENVIIYTYKLFLE